MDHGKDEDNNCGNITCMTDDTSDTQFSKTDPGETRTRNHCHRKAARYPLRHEA